MPPFRLGLEKRGVGLLRHLEAAAVLSIVQIHVHVLAPAPLVPIPPAAGRARGERIIQNPLSVVVFIKATLAAHSALADVVRVFVMSAPMADRSSAALRAPAATDT